MDDTILNKKLSITSWHMILVMSNESQIPHKAFKHC